MVTLTRSARSWLESKGLLFRQGPIDNKVFMQLLSEAAKESRMEIELASCAKCGTKAPEPFTVNSSDGPKQAYWHVLFDGEPSQLVSMPGGTLGRAVKLVTTYEVPAIYLKSDESICCRKCYIEMTTPKGELENGG